MALKSTSTLLIKPLSTYFTNVILFSSVYSDVIVQMTFYIKPFATLPTNIILFTRVQASQHCTLLIKPLSTYFTHVIFFSSV
ncbi:uncharacterized protein LOC135200624 [Macrobrachium nipponense]|uniref:uncharacterized protein LOC135200624 n=1 Tax=Macrobrachium nipponense TaxID=159736 RepID=UPI0030C825CC